MFDNLDYLAPSKTVSYTLHGVRTAAEHVVLSLVYAGSGTTFFSEFSKLKQPGRDATQEQRCAYREHVARLFATHAVIDWEHVVDGNQPVAFTPDNCLALFRKLIRVRDYRGEQVGRWDLIDGAIAHAMNPDNFTAPIVEAADLGKG